jgi:hypothetical protein
MPQNEGWVKELLRLLNGCRAGFGQERVYVRAVMLVLAEILSFGGHQVTALLRSVGLVHEDWTAWYRLLQKPTRLREERLGQALVGETVKQVSAGQVYVIGIDSSTVPRHSRKLEGTSWHKCPRNPPWRIGIERAQRFLNVSWLAPLENGYSRAIPLRFLPCFPEKAVHQAHAAQVEPRAGVEAVAWVREQLDDHDPERPLLCLADGSFDRVEFWTQLPARVTAMVRTAKNRVLKYLPPPYCGRGRRRKYGERAPAPQAYLSQSDGWHPYQIPVRGHDRRVVARVEGPFVRDKMPDCPLMLIVVRGQEFERDARQHYREPAYYLVNAVLRDGQWQLPLPLETLLTWAWQRWELEVVHREVKSILGLGHKQCFHPLAAVTSVQWSAWVYSLLMLTAYLRLGAAFRPKRHDPWQRHPRRWTLTTVLDEFRHELLTHPDFSWIHAYPAPIWPKFEAALQPLLSPLRHLSLF